VAQVKERLGGGGATNTAAPTTASADAGQRADSAKPLWHAESADAVPGGDGVNWGGVIAIDRVPEGIAYRCMKCGRVLGSTEQDWKAYALRNLAPMSKAQPRSCPATSCHNSASSTARAVDPVRGAEPGRGPAGPGNVQARSHVDADSM